MWWIEVKELIQELRKKLSVGVSETDEFNIFTILVQGDKIDEVISMLTDYFKVPFKYIVVEDKIAGKKNKKGN